MDQPMSKEESYADRRQLFKNIWETAMNTDEKEGNVINKPKVIKTLRLDEVDRCIAGKKKKQRIKNLRIVCNKLLDFCDRQDADDMFYEQMVTKGRESPSRREENQNQAPKKLKSAKEKRKAKKARSMFISEQHVAKATSPERRAEIANVVNSKSSRNTSPIKTKRASFVYKSPLLAKKSLNAPNKCILESTHTRKANRPQKFTGPKILERTFSNKQLFPITKVNIK